jgi:hypothetical protein
VTPESADPDTTDRAGPVHPPHDSRETAPPASDPQRFEMEELGKKDARWHLLIRPGDLALFEGDDPQPFVILREQLLAEGMLVEGMRALVLNKPRKLTFKLSPEGVKAIADWIGKPALAAFHLKRRYTWVLPLAIIWLISALPTPGNAEAGIEAQPLDLVALGLGSVLVVSWAFAKWRPHPVLFLMDSIWFLWLAGYLVLDVVRGRSLLWLILVALLLRMVMTGFRHFARFRDTSIPQPGRKSRSIPGGV